MIERVSEQTVKVVYETTKDLCKAKHMSRPNKAMVRTVLQALALVRTATDRIANGNKG